MRAALSVLMFVGLALAGCTATETDRPAPQYIPGDPSTPGAEFIAPQHPDTIASRLMAVGAVDGPTSRENPGRAGVQAVRGHDPGAFEPPLAAPLPGKEPLGLAGIPVPPDPFPVPKPPLNLDGPPPFQCERPPIHPDAFAAFDDVVTAYQPEGGWYAAQLGVSDRCGLLYEQGYGVMGERPWVADYPGNDPQATATEWWQHALEPVGPDALFKIASTTKPVTSAVIHQMVRQGIIDYDDPIFCDGAGSNENFWIDDGDDRKCLLSLDPAPNAGGLTEVSPLHQAITVQWALEHKVGWDRDSDTGDFLFLPRTVGNANQGVPPSREDFLRFALSQNFDYWPGTNPGSPVDGYSNTGFLMLGLVIEEWGTKSYIEYVRDMMAAGGQAADAHLGESLADDFHEREVSYPCAGTRTALYPESPDPVCYLEGGVIMEAHHYGGSLLTTAGDLADWMSRYWVDSSRDVNKGQPRYRDEANYTDYPDGQEGTHTGSLWGVKSFVQQCMNGYNFAFLSNSAVNTSTFPYDEMRDDLCDAVNDFRAGGPRGLVHIFNTAHEWEVLHALPGPVHADAAQDLVDHGFRPEDVDCHSAGDEIRYSSSWSDRTGPSFAARQGQTTSDLQTEMEERLDDGFRPIRISACVVQGTVRWNTIWEHDPDATWSAHPGMTEEDFLAEAAAKKQAGWRPVDIAVYQRGAPWYAAIWEPTPPATGLSSRAAADWHLLLDVDHQTMRDTYIPRYHDGIHVTAIDVLRNGDHRYSAIWTAAAPDVTTIAMERSYATLMESHADLAVQYDRGAFLAVA